MKFSYAIVDLDKTIFDCSLLEKQLFELTARYQVTVEHYRAAYRQALHTHNPILCDYTPEEHVYFLKQLGYNLPDTLVAEMYQVSAVNNIFPGAINFLKALRVSAEKLILLTAGDEGFQSFKISNFDIKDLFDEVVIIPGEKDKYLKERNLSGKIIFINDNLEENRRMRDAFPKMLIITKTDRKKYSEAELEQSGFPYFDDLPQIIEYVKQL